MANKDELINIKMDIRKAIRRRYNMSVSSFSRSDECKMLKIPGKNLSMYLTPKGPTSIKVLNKLAKVFDVPGIKMARKVSYEFKRKRK